MDEYYILLILVLALLASVLVLQIIWRPKRESIETLRNLRQSLFVNWEPAHPGQRR